MKALLEDGCDHNIKIVSNKKYQSLLVYAKNNKKKHSVRILEAKGAVSIEEAYNPKNIPWLNPK